MTRLTEIEERAKATKPGDWRTNADPHIWAGSAKNPRTVCATVYDDADKDFIVHARSDIPYLLSLLRSAEEALTKIRNDGYEVRKHVSPSNVAAWNAIAGIQNMAESMLSKIREEGGRGK